MKTRIVTTDRSRASLGEVRALGRILADGGLVVFPTETVYGIAAARDDGDAVRRLVELKGRAPGKPLTIHLGDRGALDALAAPLSPPAARLAARLWPGPLTLVVPDAEGGFTGFRLPDDDAARDLVRGAGTVVVASSANRAGEPPAVSGRSAVRGFDGKVEAIVDGGRTRHAAPSAVARVDGRRIEVLRAGVIPEEEILEAAAFRILFVCTGNLCRSPMAEAILKAMLAERLETSPAGLLRTGYLVESAGTGAMDGDPATPEARRSAEAYGAELDGHASRSVTLSAVTSADRILVAEARHRRIIEEFVPDAAGRIRTILTGGEDLPDPFGRSEEVYRRTADRIHGALGPLVEEILSEERGEP